MGRRRGGYEHPHDRMARERRQRAWTRRLAIAALVAAVVAASVSVAILLG